MTDAEVTPGRERGLATRGVDHRPQIDPDAGFAARGNQQQQARQRCPAVRGIAQAADRGGLLGCEERVQRGLPRGRWLLGTVAVM